MPGYGNLIRQARRSAKLTQSELADRLGVSAGSVSAYENEYTDTIPPEMFVKLCMALDTLSPVRLVEAIGYPVQASSEERVPPRLARMLVQLSNEDLQMVERLVRGLLAASPDRTG